MNRTEEEGSHTDTKNIEAESETTVSKKIMALIPSEQRTQTRVTAKMNVMKLACSRSLPGAKRNRIERNPVQGNDASMGESDGVPTMLLWWF